MALPDNGDRHLRKSLLDVEISKCRRCPDMNEEAVTQACRFSNSVSYRGLLTCVSPVCLTSFHLGLSHFAFHFLAVPVSGFDVPGCFLDDLNP